MEQNFTLNPNPLVQFLQKEQKEFTKADIIKYVTENQIEMINFRYVGADGRLKTLNFIISSLEHLDSILTYGERVDGSSLFPYIEAGSSDLYVIPRYRTAFLNPFSEIPALDILCSYYTKDGKIKQGKAIIALNREEFVGFCYIESWGHEKFVANSGLIVKPAYRGMGVAKKIKRAAFELSRKKFPQAKLFGLTTGEQVMRINTELGYVPVTFAKLTDDEQFWAGCQSCVNYDILQRTNMTKCLCTGMVYDPEAIAKREAELKKVGRKRSGIIRLLKKFACF